MDEYSTPWTGDLARNLSSFCYYYPDLRPSTSSDAVKTTINALYGQDCLVGPAAALIPVPSTKGNLTPRAATSQNTRSLAALSQSINNLITHTGAMRDYIANIRIDSITIRSTVKVYLFDGPVSDDRNTWDTSAFFIGQRSFLNGHTRDNSMQGSKYQKGTIALSSTLMSRVQSGALSGMSNDEVTVYLRDRLLWKVVKVIRFRRI